MAWFVIAESADVDWHDEYKYKCRYKSRDGSPVAQGEIERRRAAGRPTVLWRWENNSPTLVEQHNA